MTEKKTAKKPAPRKSAKPKAARTVRITLLRSPIGETYRHKGTIRALGLRRIRQTVEQADTPQLRGMLAKVGHLVKVEAGTGKEKSS
ncbi:MAG: 50S ribosomal protein L30 [Anaerolineales bacterium]|jgi:large subunit ribosomal protein L30